MILKQRQGFLNLSFSWLFALIVGAFILFFAIFFVVKLVNTTATQQGAVTSTTLETFLNPLETGYEESSVSVLDLGVESVLYLDCDASGNFGNQIISSNQRLFGSTQGEKVRITFANRYLFSSSELDGRRFYLFSKSLDLPFKVADAVYLLNSEQAFCFVRAPERLRNETQALGLMLIRHVNSLSECSGSETTVCFTRGDCDVLVSEFQGLVTKGTTSVSYEGDTLLYGAIFADAATYECETLRLIKRLRALAALYSEKKTFVLSKQCATRADLATLMSAANSYTDSRDLALLFAIAQDVEKERGGCALW